MRSLFGLLALLVLFSCTSSTEQKHKVYKERIVNDKQEEEDGKALFQANCASCHHPMKDGTGPALRELIDQHSSKWLLNFFTNRTLLKKDTAYQRIRTNAWEPNCFEFPYITEPQINAIKDYLEGCNRGCVFN